MTRKPLLRERLLRYGAGAGLVLTVAGSILGPAALAQTLPLQPVPVQVTAPAETTAPALTVGETQPLTLAVTEGPYFKVTRPRPPTSWRTVCRAP